MFGSKKKKKTAPVKEKKKKLKAEVKKADKKPKKSFLRPMKERKAREKKEMSVKKEKVAYIEEVGSIAYQYKPMKLQEKKLLTAEGWKRLLKKK